VRFNRYFDEYSVTYCLFTINLNDECKISVTRHLQL
jgi:hypothetical protein